MYEAGCLNREITKFLARQGHTDRFMICDAGFAIPDTVHTIDISISQNNPTVETTIKEVLRNFSVEGIIISDSMITSSPSKFDRIKQLFGKDIPCSSVSQDKLRELSNSVKFIIRTGDFTAFSNILVVSGAGDRWFIEKKSEI
jgi:D-ribose pyranase